MSSILTFLFIVFILFRPPELKANDNGSPSQETQAPAQNDPTPPSDLNGQQSDRFINPISLVNETSAPSAIVNNSVNVITGDLIISGTECVVSGPDGYILGHNYTSSLDAMEKKNLGYGWSLQHSDRLLVFQPQGINYTKEVFSLPDEFLPKTKPPIGYRNDYTSIYLSESHGGKALFKGDGWAKHFKPVIKKTGFTNSSGKTNLKNITVHRRYSDDQWIATLGDNTKRIYSRVRKQRTHLKEGKFNYHFRKYRITEEIRPSGNRQIFKYDNDTGRLSKVETVNSEKTNVLSWVKFKYLENESKEDTIDIQVETSDGDTFLYGRRAIQGIKEKDIKTVTKIKRPGLPLQHFYYTNPSKVHERRIKEIRFGDVSVLTTKYYRRGPNMMRNHLDDRTDKKYLDFVEGKVRFQEAPLGPGGESVKTHTYYYHNEKNRCYHTTVVDACGTKTRYYHGLNKRLRLIEKSVKEEVIAKEEFVWGKRDTSQEGNLLCSKLYDENNVVYARSYEYDKKGNVIKETHFGNFTGKTEGVVLVDKETRMPKKESSCDVIEKVTTYSNDEFNLKTSEKDFAGNYTYYRYKPGTSLLTAKLICEGTNIKKREFFTYDHNAILFKEIIDDGSSDEKYDLKDVTERKVKIITPRYAAPYFGVAERIEEYYEDPKTQERHLLTITQNTFNDKGLIIRKTLYDSRLNLVGKTSYTYDENKRLISTTDPVGRVEKLDYDEFGRVIKKRGPRDDVSIHYTSIKQDV